MRFPALTLILSLLLTFSLNAKAEGPPEYAISPIPTPFLESGFSFTSFYISDINNDGAVVGFFVARNYLTSETYQRGFSWSEEQGYSFIEVPSSLKVYPQWINNKGSVSGWAQFEAVFPITYRTARAFLLRDTNLQLIGPDDAYQAGTKGLNEKDEFVGLFDYPNDGLPKTWYRFSNGDMEILNALIEDQLPQGSTFSFPQDQNDSGAIVGLAENQSGKSDTFVFEGGLITQYLPGGSNWQGSPINLNLFGITNSGELYGFGQQSEPYTSTNYVRAMATINKVPFDLFQAGLAETAEPVVTSLRGEIVDLATIDSSQVSDAADDGTVLISARADTGIYSDPDQRFSLTYIPGGGLYSFTDLLPELTALPSASFDALFRASQISDSGEYILGYQNGSYLLLRRVGDDSDSDGVDDTEDNCLKTPNPDQSDSDVDGQGDACDTDDDNDGVEDVLDNCPFDSNNGQADFDGDGIGDVCDSDNDNDGVLDENDNCPLVNNAGQDDTDGDSEGDACDADDDDDQVADEVDNCPLVANPGQENSDGVGAGDACLDESVDADGDLFENSVDNCPNVSNPSQYDFDGDSVGDVCDPDDDNDYVFDEYDTCPNTAAGGEVDGEGCTLSQRCPCTGPAQSDELWKNKGQYVSCVAKAATAFVSAGVISETTGDQVKAAASESSCGEQ